MAKRLTEIDKEDDLVVKNVLINENDPTNIDALHNLIIDKINTISQDLDEVYRRLDELES
jgi:hypothetical protein